MLPVQCLDGWRRRQSFTYLMKRAIGFGVDDARLSLLRLLQRRVGALPLRAVLDSRLDH
jgi:hypothetical protein